ncbi:MAG: TolC family protein [Chryseolinea sp.]
MLKPIGFFLLLVSVIPAHAQQDVTLKESLRLARKRNPDLKVLLEDVRSARADRVTAQIRPNPNVNLQLLHIANPNYRREGTGWANDANTQYWYQITKPFQVAGQRQNKIAFADRMIEQSRLDYNEASRMIYLDVASQWVDVWAARVNLNILTRGKRNIDSLVQINTYRLKDKVITETDLVRTQLLQQQYQRDIVTAEQILINERENLRYLIGSTDSISIALDDQSFFGINTIGDSLIEEGVHHRSDVLSAKNTIDASKTNINLQKSLSYPQPELGAVFNPQNRIPYVGFYGIVEIPIFNRNQGQREKADVQKYKAEQNLLATQRQAESEVNIAYRTYTTQRKNLADYQGNLNNAEIILRNVRYSYVRGATSVIDYLEAQRSWLDTQQRYYSTMEDFRRSYVNLLFATGIINQLAE